MEPVPPPLPNLPPPDAPLPDDTAPRRILGHAALLTFVGDFFLWSAVPGLSLGLFAIACCAAILLSRPAFAHTRYGAIALFLLIASAFQTAVDTSFSNILVLLLLIGAILGESYFPAIQARWVRWAEGILALVRTPLAWRWAAPVLKRLPRKPGNFQRHREIAVQVGLPTVGVVVLFAWLLGSGNVIFARWIGEFLWGAADLIPSMNPGRILLWLLLATLSLGILRPAAPVLPADAGTRPVPRFRAPQDLKLARWRTVSVLAALNAVFFAANTVDAVYLWIHRAVPEGVNYSAYVHQGVHSLTFAVLLSALVLATVYQQASQVVESRIVRTLALCWIAQNVVLLAGVLMRLHLYVQAYQLTELRVYVAAFLCLVATGFALLAWRIVADKSLRWLILANGGAAFALFFLIQFPDVAKWVADRNVARWQEDPTRSLDVAYLAELGPSAYPALIIAAETPGRPDARDAFLVLDQKRPLERWRLEGENWRSVQWRKNRYAKALVAHQLRTIR